ncbi:hypothetical protein DL95DRAFT_477433, partial [Leptodontidium sp. 2 PMI_412]
GWKPATLQAPVLGGFIVISLSIIIVLEILSHISARSSNGGGLAFAADVDDLSYGATWVDLDVKRLEPWFQLSRENGALAEDSLLLQYPFDFLPFIPVTACRRKHWGVFLAGTIMLLVFWVITPLQSAIFATGVATRSIPTTFGTSTALIPFESQIKALNANFLNTAYGVSWLGQRLPDFTTSTYATLAFQPISHRSKTLSTETWISNAFVYSTNLTCKPANVIPERTLSYSFDNGEGCSVSDSSTLSSDYMVNYIGFYSNAHTSYSLQNPNCTAEHSNNFLALFATAADRTTVGVYRNLTAIFCKPSYHSQEMKVTVNASSHSIVEAKVASSRKLATPTSIEEMFNVTTFEYILGTGISPLEERTNFDEISIVQQYPRVKNYNLTFPVSNMVGFAVSLNSAPIQDLADPEVLRRAFERAHQLLFTSALSTLTEPIQLEDLQDAREGMREERLGAILLVREISLAVEVAFAIIIALTISLWIFSFYRTNLLDSDPASIASIMSVIPSSGEISEGMLDDGTLTAVELEQNLSQKRYRLSRDNHEGLFIQSLSPMASRPPQVNSSKSQPDKDFAAVRPVELRLPFGVVLVIIIVLAIAGVVFLHVWTASHNGISLPSRSSIVRSVIENYAPTAFATFLEPVWTLLNRLLCLLQPFDELRKGNAPASTSLDVKYTSLPPQLAFWRAFRSRHFILGVVCIVAVSTNLLAVALTGLLNEKGTTVLVDFPSLQKFVPKFNGSAVLPPGILSGPGLYFDHYYVSMSNITQGTPLPSWIDEKFFYIPFELQPGPVLGKPDLALDAIRGSTTGFGVNVTCTQLQSTGNDVLQFGVNRNGSNIQFSTSHVLEDDNRARCIYRRSANHTATETTNDLFPFPNGGAAALEVVQTMQASANTSDAGFCASTMIMGWVRAVEQADAPPSNVASSGRNISTTFLSCTQKLLIAEFDLTVDTSGRIIQSNQTSDFVTDTTHYFPVNETSSTNITLPVSSETALFQQTAALMAGYGAFDFAWHNDSFTSDWINSLLGLMINSTRLVDPAAAAPDATFIGFHVEKLYEQLFAVLLGLNTQVFPVTDEGKDVNASAIYIETRIFVSPLMFKFTVIILSIHLLVAIIYYSYRPRRFLPRMPTSLASIIAFVSASRALEDFNEKPDGVERLGDQRFGYGRFIGTDGKTHVGIEQQRFVVPLKSRNPEVRSRKWGWTFGKEDERQPKTWI